MFLSWQLKLEIFLFIQFNKVFSPLRISEFFLHFVLYLLKHDMTKYKRKKISREKQRLIWLYVDKNKDFFFYSLSVFNRCIFIPNTCNVLKIVAKQIFSTLELKRRVNKKEIKYEKRNFDACFFWKLHEKKKGEKMFIYNWGDSQRGFVFYF